MISNRRASRAFTLLELTIVVLVIAILSVIAVTSYTRYGYRARRADGKELLLRVANAQERYYATFNKYGGDPVTGDLKFGSTSSEKGYYTVTISGSDLTKAYTATVTPQGDQARDVCGALSIDSTGTKLPAATDTAKNKNGNCW
jgi:type IV pilus assembly protein PilE